VWLIPFSHSSLRRQFNFCVVGVVGVVKLVGVVGIVGARFSRLVFHDTFGRLRGYIRVLVSFASDLLTLSFTLKGVNGVNGVNGIVLGKTSLKTCTKTLFPCWSM
jgi:hypothetical protein